METMAAQYRRLARAERVNVMFYDHERKELYKRVRSGHGESLKCIPLCGKK